jgi:sodium transport system permease protein
MRLHSILVIYRKELRDMMRDRRTVFGMFLFPLIIFPLMTVGFNRFEASMRKKARQELSRIMLLGAEHAPELAGKLRSAEGVEIVPTTADYAKQINDKQLRVAVEFSSGFESALLAPSGAAPEIKIYGYATELRSDAAATRVEEVVAEYRKSVVERRLKAQGMSNAFVKPIETKSENVAAVEKVSGSRLGIIIPYFMIFLCLMGAMHPAMDLTAGEKERGTLETILASGVHRGEIVLGKFLLVLTVSLTTTAVSLLSYAVTMSQSRSYMQEMTGGSYTLSFTAVASIFLLLVPLVVLFSSALLAISLLAKNYKEAQSYLSPLVFVVILPAMAAMIPGVELNMGIAMIPIANVSLVTKELLTGNFPVAFLAMTFASTAVFAGIALYIAYEMFQREDVLFRS